MPFNLNPANPYLPWLEEMEGGPEAMYRAFLPQGSRRWTNYFQGQFGDVYKDYMAQLARTGLMGEAPTQSFASFASQYPFLSEYLGLGPGQRGQRQAGRTFWDVWR